MADFVAFANTKTDAQILRSLYSDALAVRIALTNVDKVGTPGQSKLWLDPEFDGLYHLRPRSSTSASDDEEEVGSPDQKSEKEDSAWVKLYASIRNWSSFQKEVFQKNPNRTVVTDFVSALLDRCLNAKPEWITVPQIPFYPRSPCPKTNSLAASAASAWKTRSGFSGKLILPVIAERYSGIYKGKTARNPVVRQAVRSLTEAGADGVWVVDKSLADQSGTSTFEARFRDLIRLHEELETEAAAKAVKPFRVGGPYWGLNLVLWARGLVNYPAIALGSSYQYHLSGGMMHQAKLRLAIPPLRRWSVSLGLGDWLLKAGRALPSGHPARVELQGMLSNYPQLNVEDAARRQIATFYRAWIDSLLQSPPDSRQMLLYRQFSDAYVLGKAGLPELPEKGTARQPEIVAKQMMLVCL